MSEHDQPDEPWDRDAALDVLRAGRVADWNDHRRRHPQWHPDLSDPASPAQLAGARLSRTDDAGAVVGIDLGGARLMGADLTATDLRGVSLVGTDLSDAVMNAADLRHASIAHANLARANLNGTNLAHARLPLANLTGAGLIGSDLREANLELCDCTHANFQDADLRGANLIGANLNGANVAGVVYARPAMKGKYENVRVASAYGNAIFRRDAEDQAFLDALASWTRKQRGRTRAIFRTGFFLWWLLTDYGRSFLRVSLFALLAVLVFGAIYDVLNCIDLNTGSGRASPFLPYYYSITTYTRGFGLAVPTTVVGECVVVIEVIFGYVTLGLMLSILGNRIARARDEVHPPCHPLSVRHRPAHQ